MGGLSPGSEPVTHADGPRHSRECKDEIPHSVSGDVAGRFEQSSSLGFRRDYGAVKPSAVTALAQQQLLQVPASEELRHSEVVKQTRDVEQSKVIETQSVVPSKRLIETNHLIIQENETRNVGTIQHNHTIIEKELVLTKRNVDTKQVNTVVNLVEHKYNTQRQHVVEEREIPGENRNLTNCNCESPVRAYGMAQAANAYGSAPKYVKARY